MSAARILVVEDEPLVRDTISGILEGEGYHIAGVGTGEEALSLLGRDSFDAVILDVGLPGISGFDTLRAIRARSDVPVVFVTAAGSLEERVAGFDLGADDYIVKPAEVPELSRRVRAILRRRSGNMRPDDELAGPAGVVMRVRSHEVYIDERPVHLTPKEFSVLRVLLQHRGEVVSPDVLAREVWGHPTLGSRNFVEAHISRLRTKLAKHGAADVVTTMRGVGYLIRWD